MSVVPFVPKDALDARRNVEEFVQLARDELKVFGADLDFDAPQWPVGVQIWGPRTRDLSLSFRKFGGISRKPAPPLDEPFGSFIKAYVRYSYGLGPTKTVGVKIAAFRALEEALEGRKVWEIDSGILNEAARVIRERWASNRAANCGGYLEELSDFLDRHHMTAHRLAWRNPIPLKTDHLRTVSLDSAKKRSEQLPSQAALDALPSIFRSAEGVADAILTGIIGLLVAAPERISEVLTLPVKCEVEQDGLYGIAWRPVKGGEATVKWIIPSMVEIVREAIKRLREATVPARIIARWYEENPNALYLPPELVHLRSQTEVTTRDIAAICGSNSITSPFAKVLKLTPVRRKRLSTDSHAYLFRDVEAALLKLMPRGFPIFDDRTGMKFSEALCAIRMNELIPSRSTHHSVVQRINIVHVNAFLGAGPESRTSSLFERYGFTEPDGSRIVVTSHAFRHWLNTIAQRGGLSQIDIARWSGRKSVAQNQAYNHITADEFLATVEGIAANAGDVKVFGPMGEIAPQDPVERAEFMRMQIPAAHTTDLGFCIHDFALTPCQLHGDCGNCSEHTFIKGDARQKASVETRIEETESALKHARAAETSGAVGADRWTVHQMKTIERLKRMKAIHEDASIPDGSIVQLPTPEMPSEIRISIDKRADEDADLKALLANIRLG
ncbi:hypothetical protein HNQ36_002193 [Afipia massiliensis]|uniref:Integrase n=1 Tax=Afipia massiliensis TaxID=211460 RepID=A0A840MV49_9BRAD|nr:integrase [Afipia massiliensis]MBB5052219.1 hypothetical protein [Afipia massiliensis]